MENNQDKKIEFEDIYSDSKKKPTYKKGHKPLSEREICYPNKFVEFMLKNNKRNTKIILAVFVSLLVLFVALLVGLEFYSNKFDMMLTPDEGWSGDENYTETFEENEFDAMHSVTDAGSLDDLLKKWHNNGGSLMDQDYVTNVLLLGIDGKNGVKNGGNSDSMILASINKKTKKITLVSFMRDSRTYYNINGRDYWAKMNSAFPRGGAAATVRTIENNYKIDIDYFIAVDFSTFSDLVNALGGVTLDIKEYEQKYINRTTTKIKKIPNYGTVTLDGDQALVYCRIRKCDADSDVSRTRRQRNFISSLIRSAKGASLSQLNGAIDAVLPHLLTDCDKNTVLNFATQALTQGWMNYEIVQLTMPDEDTRKDANFNGVSYWVVDYPLAAQRVQRAIYGTTNIRIDSRDETALDYLESISQPDNRDEVPSDNSSSGEYATDSEGQTGESEQVTGETETTRHPLYPDWWGGDDDEEETTLPTEDETTLPPEPETAAPPEEETADPYGDFFNR